MPRPDEGLIHTWLDGECTPEEAARIERLVATDPEWAAAVAEARGLIAASSRIVSALDTVPAAMPPGAQAAPRRSERRGFRVLAWMGMAAALVLVAGTAYVLREQANKPFAPTIATDTRPPAVSDAADSTAAPTLPSSQPATVGNAQSAVSASAERGGSGGSADVAPASAGRDAGIVPAAPPPPSATPEPRSERAAAAQESTEEQLSARRQSEQAKAESASAERELRLSRSALRQAPVPVPTAAAPLADAAIVVLEGCWRVSAPPEQVGLLRYPQVLAQRGDSLLLHTLRDSVWVLRTAERLSGGLEAQREACPPATP